MTRQLAGMGSAVLLIAGVAVLAGCTHDKVISSGNASAAFEASVTSAPPDRFESAKFGLSRAVVTALDPDAFTNLGAAPVDMVPNQRDLDLHNQTMNIFFETSLPPGEYRLDRLDWFPPTLVDADASPTAPTCIEKITAFPPPLTTGIQVFPLKVPISPPVVFTAGPGGLARVRIEVDAEGLVNDYLARWICVDGLNERCGTEPAPCLRNWDSFGFNGAIPTYVSVTVE